MQIPFGNIPMPFVLKYETQRIGKFLKTSQTQQCVACSRMHWLAGQCEKTCREREEKNKSIRKANENYIHTPQTGYDGDV